MLDKTEDKRGHYFEGVRVNDVVLLFTQADTLRSWFISVNVDIY